MRIEVSDNKVMVFLGRRKKPNFTTEFEIVKRGKLHIFRIPYKDKDKDEWWYKENDGAYERPLVEWKEITDGLEMRIMSALDRAIHEYGYEARNKICNHVRNALIHEFRKMAEELAPGEEELIRKLMSVTHSVHGPHNHKMMKTCMHHAGKYGYPIETPDQAMYAVAEMLSPKDWVHPKLFGRLHRRLRFNDFSTAAKISNVVLPNKDYLAWEWLIDLYQLDHSIFTINDQQWFEINQNYKGVEITRNVYHAMMAVAKATPKELRKAVRLMTGGSLMRREVGRVLIHCSDLIGKQRAFRIAPTATVLSIAKKYRSYTTNLEVRVKERICEISEDYPGAYTAKPPIPLPQIEGLRLLDTMVEVVAEGKEMVHCVGGYSPAAVEGRCYLFHYQGKTPVTIEVTPQGRVRQAYSTYDSRTPDCEYIAGELNAWGEALRATGKAPIKRVTGEFDTHDFYNRINEVSDMQANVEVTGEMLDTLVFKKGRLVETMRLSDHCQLRMRDDIRASFANLAYEDATRINEEWFALCEKLTEAGEFIPTANYFRVYMDHDDLPF